MILFQTLGERCTFGPKRFGFRPVGLVSGQRRSAHRRQRGSRAAAAVLVFAAAILGGCAVGPHFVAPERPSEQTYVARPNPELGTAQGAESGQHLAMGQALQADWWVLLQSPELNRVVELALASNWSLDSARANLARAKEAVTVARGGLYPQVDAVGSAGRRKYGASFLGPQAATFPIFSAYSIGGDVSYDVDAFGHTKRTIELANAGAAIQQESLNAARLDVAGSTVMMALQIASVRAQVDVVQNILSSDQQTLSLVHSARAAGVASDMDVTTAQSQLDRDRTLLPPLNQQLAVAQDALAVLTGHSPAQWNAPDLTLAKMTLPHSLPLAVPSNLVRDRPDIRAAEANLHAANAAVGAATADLYPRITLSAGMAEEGLMNGPAGAAWSVIGGITAPIFHGGALSAQRRAAQDAYTSAFAQYQQTVLTSFEQVADSLHALENDAESVRSEEQALASADAALRLTRLGYGVGNTGIVLVLDAQRLRQLADIGLVQARAQQYVDTTRLFLAAGGGLTGETRVSAAR
jgi:NodT family efflux transporter outer membrane factor (OMF) lipoprotein